MNPNQPCCTKKTKLVTGFASLALLLGFAAYVLLFSNRERPRPGTFPELLSADQDEIEALARKDSRQRAYLALKGGFLKTAWRHLRFAQSQQIIAVGYKTENTNHIWVYSGIRNSGAANGWDQTITIAMTNTHGYWRITQ